MLYVKDLGDPSDMFPCLKSPAVLLVSLDRNFPTRPQASTSKHVSTEIHFILIKNAPNVSKSLTKKSCSLNFEKHTYCIKCFI